MSITNEKVTEYINSLYTPLTSELAQLRDEAESDRIPIIRRETEELILSILRIARPSTLLEIGTAVGYSASCFAECLSNLNIVTIESDEAVAGTAEKNIERLGYSDRIKILVGDAKEVLKKIDPSENNKFDIVFIDAAKGQYRAFWDAAKKYFKVGTIVISDNILMRGSTASDEFDISGRFKTSIKRMREFLIYIKNLNYSKTSLLSSGDGVAISVITEDPKDD